MQGNLFLVKYLIYSAICFELLDKEFEFFVGQPIPLGKMYIWTGLLNSKLDWVSDPLYINHEAKSTHLSSSLWIVVISEKILK